MKLNAIGDNILCTDGDFGNQKTKSGIIIQSNAKQSEGITPRWFKVLSIGPDVKPGIVEGKWILVEYGRWSNGVDIDQETTIWKIDPECCMAIADEKPDTFYYNRDVATASKLTR